LVSVQEVSREEKSCRRPPPFPPSQRGSKELSRLDALAADESIVISLGAFRIAAIASDESMRASAPDSSAWGQHVRQRARPVRRHQTNLSGWCGCCFMAADGLEPDSLNERTCRSFWGCIPDWGPRCCPVLSAAPRHRQQASLLRSSSQSWRHRRSSSSIRSPFSGYSIRPNVQSPMAVRQVGGLRFIRKIFADASKIASCARFSDIRTFGRFVSEEIAVKGCFDRGSRRPTPP
jgi:hypothetical protein